LRENQRIRARITGTGSALPERVVTNHDLEKIVDTSDQWIVERTGIRERRFAEEGDTLSDYAAVAAQRAMEQAGIAPEDVDIIICGTVTPDWHLPASACFIQERLKAVNAFAFDVIAGCSGFLYGLGIADQYIRTGAAKCAVVIGAELLSKFIDWEDRATCVIFADGAGAAVLQAEEGEYGILGSVLHSAGEAADLICIPGGGTMYPPSEQTLANKQHYIKMKGSETFKLAIRRLTEVCLEVLREEGFDPSAMKYFIPHQANKRIIDAVAHRLELTDSQCVINVDRMGNTSAASIPIALDEINREGRLGEGDLVLFAAFGAGLTWASALVRW